MKKTANNLKTKQLGNSDLFITSIGFGSWAVGGPWQFGWSTQDDHDSIAAIHRALELGINWIDTAAIYGLGHSEEVVAKALAQWQGDRPYVFTKCGMIWDKNGKVDYSLKADSIRREVENSLRRLQVETIDLYQIHWPVDELEETDGRLDGTGQAAEGRQSPLDRRQQFQRGGIAPRPGHRCPSRRFSRPTPSSSATLRRKFCPSVKPNTLA